MNIQTQRRIAPTVSRSSGRSSVLNQAKDLTSGAEYKSGGAACVQANSISSFSAQMFGEDFGESEIGKMVKTM